MEEKNGKVEEEKEQEKIFYFFDTYAIIEILKGNSSYELYKELPVTLSQWNLAEIYYNALLNLLLGNPNEIYDEYRKAVVEIEDETLKEAMKFKEKHKQQDISYPDAIGYIYAKRQNMKFLTGDKEFESFDNVEFVK